MMPFTAVPYVPERSQCHHKSSHRENSSPYSCGPIRRYPKISTHTLQYTLRILEVKSHNVRPLTCQSTQYTRLRRYRRLIPNSRRYRNGVFLVSEAQLYLCGWHQYVVQTQLIRRSSGATVSRLLMWALLGPRPALGLRHP